MTSIDRGSNPVLAFSVKGAALGTALYFIAWLVCVIVMFGYEEQWGGPNEAFYTLGSMTGVEQAACLIGRYVLSFPVWLPQWVGDFSFQPIAALLSGAVMGGWGGGLLGRLTTPLYNSP